MKLPSVEHLYKEATRTVRRFPFVLFAALGWTVASLQAVELEGKESEGVWFSLIFAFALGMPLLAAVTLTAEKRKSSRGTFVGVMAIAIVLLIAYGISIPTNFPDGPANHGLRFAVLMAASVLLLMVAPYLKAGEQNGFWQYNRTLYFRLFITALYAGVLFAGLAIALAALDNLFGVEVPGRRYAELWITVVGLFGTWFFLAGIPRDLDELEQSQNYPRGLRVFAQYILLTLVAVYLVILYAYIAKILIQWNWPRGWVSSLILGYSATAIIALMFLYPIRDRAGSAWVTAASRWLYVLLIPLIVVLFLAVTERISDYGITESRYAGIVLGLWLSAQVLYFLLSKRKNIKFTVGSLCALAFAISAGPWGMFAVSERSQVGRLKALLTKNDILVQGRVQKATEDVSVEDQEQISSIVDYLRAMHGYGRVRHWFAEELQEETDRGGKRDKLAGDLVRLMGIEFTLPDTWASKGKRLARDTDHPINLAGYDKLARQGNPWNRESREASNVEGLRYRIDGSSNAITFELIESGAVVDSLTTELNLWKRQVLEKYADSESASLTHLSPEDMAIQVEGVRFRAKAFPNSIYIDEHSSDTSVDMHDLVVLYSLRSEQ